MTSSCLTFDPRYEYNIQRMQRSSTGQAHVQISGHNYEDNRFNFLGHLIHSGYLLLWASVVRRSSCVVCEHFLLKNYLANLDQIWCIASVGLGDKKL